MAEADQEFIEYVVKAIVDEPSDVKVERKIDEMGVLLSLAVNPADMGKVIGKEGNTARALRTLLRVLGAKNNARVNLKILEPEGAEPRPPRVKSEEPKEEPKEAKSAPKEEKQEEVPQEKQEEKATELV
ncbi:MAG: KH domain-containing protein [Patescibacteria group bacterium]